MKIRFSSSNFISASQGFYATFYPERYALLQTWVSESEVKLGDFTRALMLSSKAIERHSTLETTVTVEKSLFRSRQTLFEHLVDHFESSHGDDEVHRTHAFDCMRLVNCSQ